MKKKLLIGFSAILIIVLVLAFTPSSLQRHDNSIIVQASTQTAWKVISDVGNYERYATGLTDAAIVSGEGVGMIRSCSDETGTWQETCTAWKEGRSYTFRVDVNTGFPYPFKVFNGTWSVDKRGEDSSLVSISFDYQFPYRWMYWFFDSDTHKFIDAGNTNLLNNWKKAIQGS